MAPISDTVKLLLPNSAEHILSVLHQHGYEAYVAGGCVRDSLLGIEPADWDICTSATPGQIRLCFPENHIIETGLKHGTITLRINHKSFEISTFRAREACGLETDASHRDFTINAMAYHPQRGLIDFFGGLGDLRAGIIRGTEDANARFHEDALRIMRAMRFASTLNFTIEKRTSEAMIENKHLLQNTAPERMAVELDKMLAGKAVGPILRAYALILCEIIPEIQGMINFSQNNPHHRLDVWEHTVLSIENAPADTRLRLTMLLHDIAKPQCHTEHCGVGHFPGHSRAGHDMARAILHRLRYDNKTTGYISDLVLFHDAEIPPQRKNILRWLNKLGEDRFRLLLEVKKADTMAQNAVYQREKQNSLEAIARLWAEIRHEEACFSLKDLAVNGRDLMRLGIVEGKTVGVVLKRLLEMVINGTEKNDKNDLLVCARKMISGLSS
jgi:tRNA nucleotidyltransferase (CCA-adding enzyme)